VDGAGFFDGLGVQHQEIETGWWSDFRRRDKTTTDETHEAIESMKKENERSEQVF
jgi:hypothetical protein